MSNEPRNQINRHIPVFIYPGDDEADLILLAGHPVVIAAVGDSVDADLEADEYSTFVDVSDGTGILALDLALTQVVLAGVAVYAYDIRPHRGVLYGCDLYAQDADKNLFAYMEVFRDIPKLVPGQVAARMEYSTLKISTRTTFSATAMTIVCTMRSTRTRELPFLSDRQKNLHYILVGCDCAMTGIVKALDDEVCRFRSQTYCRESYSTAVLV